MTDLATKLRISAELSSDTVQKYKVECISFKVLDRIQPVNLKFYTH